MDSILFGCGCDDGLFQRTACSLRWRLYHWFSDSGLDSSCGGLRLLLPGFAGRESADRGLKNRMSVCFLMYGRLNLPAACAFSALRFMILADNSISQKISDVAQNRVLNGGTTKKVNI